VIYQGYNEDSFSLFHPGLWKEKQNYEFLLSFPHKIFQDRFRNACCIGQILETLPEHLYLHLEAYSLKKKKKIKTQCQVPGNKFVANEQHRKIKGSIKLYFLS